MGLPEEGQPLNNSGITKIKILKTLTAIKPLISNFSLHDVFLG
jgi:hypothetical protein